MKKLLTLIFLLLLVPYSYTQERYREKEFIEDPALFLTEPEFETLDFFKLSDLTSLRLRSITPLIDVNVDSSHIAGFLLSFDHVKTDSLDIDCFLYIEKPENGKKDSGKIMNVSFVHSNNRFFTRFYPHGTNPLYYFESGKFNPEVFKKYIIIDNFKGRLR